MHKANHEDLRLFGEEIPDPEVRYSFNPDDIEEISFKWVKERTKAKRRALRDTILGHKEE